MFKQRFLYALVFALALVLFAICLLAVRLRVGIQVEQHILLWLNSWPEQLNKIFWVITQLGSLWAAAASVAIAFMLKLYALAWRLALSILVAYGLVTAGKLFFARPRPIETVPDVAIRVHEAGAAFPSGHTVMATIIGLTILAYLPRRWGWAAIGLAVGAVALSRIYLGVHAPYDIVAGLAVGAGIVSFWRILPAKVRTWLRLQDD